VIIDIKQIFESIKPWILANIEWSIFLFIIFLLILRNLIRGYSWKTKSGEKLTIRQFFKRWGRGIEGVTYMQQLKMQIWGIWVNFLGLALGIIVMSIARPKDLWWWLVIILGAGLFLNFISFIGVYQKFKIQRRIDKTIKELNKESNETIHDESGYISEEQYSKIKPIVSPYLKYK
jgi:glycopeptide antibiotics resistance protein